MKRAPRRASGLASVALGLLLPAAWSLAHLTPRLGLWVGRRLGDAIWVALPRRRAMARANLGLALGKDRLSADLDRVGRRSFEHLGMNAVEACVFYFRPTSVLLSRVELSGLHHVEEAAKAGKGVLLLTAHYGNWELLAASHALSQFSLSVVMRPLDHPLLDRVVERFRLRSGVELISKRHALREIVEALRRGRLVGILLDQNASRAEGVFAPFFGVPASTSKAMALISLRTGAPVVPVFIRRLAGGRHVVEMSPAVPVPESGDVAEYTAAFNQAIERAIRREPEQWFWMHNRWKTRPRVEAT